MYSRTRFGGADLASTAIDHNYCGLRCLYMQPLQFSLFECFDLFIPSGDPLSTGLFGQTLSFFRTQLDIQKSLKLLTGLLKRWTVPPLFYGAFKNLRTAPRGSQLQGLIQQKKFYDSASSGTWLAGRILRPPAL